MRRYLINFWFIFTITTAVFNSVSTANASDDYSAVEVQLAGDRHLENLLIDGVINFIDFEMASSIKAVVVDNHPIIFAGDGYYVSCVTLVDAEGKEYPVDMYLYPSKNGLVVSHTVYGMVGRENFKKLAKAGVVKKLK